MTLKEIKKKSLSLIEEIDETSELLTNDPDIQKKINSVINQVQNELSRIKKMPSYIELEVSNGDVLTFDDIDSNVYQLSLIKGVKHEIKAKGTSIKILEDGIAEIEYYKYPDQVDEKSKGNMELSVGIDVLEIMPYGIAADLLKNDASNNYGNVYANRYNEMKQMLDSRYTIGFIEIEGGI